MDRRSALAMSTLAALSAVGIPSAASAAVVSGSGRPRADGFPVEYTYKTKWGHFDEFLDLYIKNHLPILKRYQQLGRILAMHAAFPFNHANESARWDLRFTIVWRDAATAHEDFAQTPEIIKELYPDEAAFKREEQHRFSLLLEHTDVPVVIDDLSTW